MDFHFHREVTYPSYSFGLTKVIPHRWMLFLNIGTWNFQIKFKYR